MTKKLKVEVRQEHIDAGECGEPRKCAIALALQEQYGFFDVYVNGLGAVTALDDQLNAYLSDEALSFIAAFDDDKTQVKPFTFYLGEGTL